MKPELQKPSNYNSTTPLPTPHIKERRYADALKTKQAEPNAGSACFIYIPLSLFLNDYDEFFSFEVGSEVYFGEGLFCIVGVLFNCCIEV